jgi:hypothetical protein
MKCDCKGGFSKAHFIKPVWICSSRQQALDERGGATMAACYEQRGCSTESTGVNISPSLVNNSSRAVSVQRIAESCELVTEPNAARSLMFMRSNSQQVSTN